jgi:hypothetical protein
MTTRSQCASIAAHLAKPGARLTSLDAPTVKNRPTAMHRIRDLRGVTLGILTVDDYSHHDGLLHWWNVTCECGTKKQLTASTISHGKQKSCGCMTKAILRESATTHGQSSGRGRRGSQAYRCWKGMFDRCTDSSRRDWMDYGGRGITICERWNSFDDFFADMGAAEEGLTLDRINTNGNYEPSNCRWATAKEQANNRRNNRAVTYKGETKNIGQWAESLGIYPDTLWRRLQAGMAPDRAFWPGPLRVTSATRPARVAECKLAVKS